MKYFIIYRYIIYYIIILTGGIALTVYTSVYPVFMCMPYYLLKQILIKYKI